MIITIIVIGTLIKNTEPHQNLVNNKPPIKGPNPAPADAIEDHMPSASALSFLSSKTCLIIASVDGIIVAAPIANITLAIIKVPDVGEKAATTDAKVKITKPDKNIFLCPTLSPNVPKPGKSPATTNGYAFTIHNF